ncbi:hypothetical protein QUF58_05585 [Anaerolineales bacterium HSG24]|nr:hypothetical protein [Anaerolineales bacterium HSG24]
MAIITIFSDDPLIDHVIPSRITKIPMSPWGEHGDSVTLPKPVKIIGLKD